VSNRQKGKVGIWVSVCVDRRANACGLGLDDASAFGVATELKQVFHKSHTFPSVPVKKSQTRKVPAKGEFRANLSIGIVQNE
jgi:hypothetical protein